jgi:large subunit ribosomal protein L17e
MLGTLSRLKEGIEYVYSNRYARGLLTPQLRLLEKFKVFTAFYHLSELRSREDLIKGIIENLDYSMYVAPNFVVHSLMRFSLAMATRGSCSRRL